MKEAEGGSLFAICDVAFKIRFAQEEGYSLW